MGTYNILKTEMECPRCQKITMQEVSLHFGYTDEMLEFNLGNKYRWHLCKEFQNGGRPEKGNIDGEGYVECELCKKDFFVKVVVRNDVIENVVFDSTKMSYIKD